MNKRRLQCSALLTGILLLVLTGGSGLWLRAEQRRYALNRHLIAVLVQGDDKQALALVEAGADPNTRYKPASVPSLPELVRQWLHLSAPPTNHSPTAFAIACGADWDGEYTTATVTQHDRPDVPKLAQEMLIHGAKVNGLDKDGNTPLMSAVAYHRRKTVLLLLEHGANVNAQTQNGTTPLMWAGRFNSNLDTMRLLLEHGARVNSQNDGGWTPLMYAANSDSDTAPDAVHLLLKCGANVNLREKDGWSALMLALCSEALPDVVGQLLEHGASVNSQDKFGRTALYVAVDSGAKTSVLYQLLACGADLNLADNGGETPLMLARNNRRPDMVALLKQAGARK